MIGRMCDSKDEDNKGYSNCVIGWVVTRVINSVMARLIKIVITRVIHSVISRMCYSK